MMPAKNSNTIVRVFLVFYMLNNIIKLNNKIFNNDKISNESMNGFDFL